mgnify:CR=1 FL=1
MTIKIKKGADYTIVYSATILLKAEENEIKKTLENPGFVFFRVRGEK